MEYYGVHTLYMRLYKHTFLTKIFTLIRPSPPRDIMSIPNEALQKVAPENLSARVVFY